MNRAILSVTLAVLLLTAGCASGLNPSRQIDDAALAQSVRDALHRDSELSRFDIRVDARSAAVTLTGIVGTAAQKTKAGSIAAGVAGVTSVENLITVR